QALRVGQGVASVDAGHRSGQVGVQMQEARPRNVSVAEGVTTEIRIGQIVPAIDQHPLRIVQVRSCGGDIDQGAVAHSAGSASAETFSQLLASSSLSNTCTSASTKICEIQALQVSH